MKVITIRDVAKRAKVSTATVSHVLNHTGQVSSKTRGAVMLAIRSLRYVPNVHARNLASASSRMLGMIVSDIENPFFPEVIKGFEKRAREQGYDVILSDTDYDSARMKRAADRMLEQKVGGIAIMTSEAEPQLIQEFKWRRTNAVLLDVGSVQKYVSNIKVDYAAGISRVIDHLHALGHRRIAFVGGLPGLKSNLLRQRAYTDCMNRFGLRAEPIVAGNLRFEGGVAAGTMLASLRPRPTAVVAINDLTAVGIMKALSRAGLRVPDDISVTGFDSTQLAQYVVPSLTTTDLRRDLLGRTAADALLDLASSPTHAGKEYFITPELKIGESTGAPPQLTAQAGNNRSHSAAAGRTGSSRGNS